MTQLQDRQSHTLSHTLHKQTQLITLNQMIQVSCNTNTLSTLIHTGSLVDQLVHNVTVHQRTPGLA